MSVQQPQQTTTTTTTPTLPRHTEILLRREDSNSRRSALKEKFVSIYEAFFKGDDPSKSNSNFWDELFLLKVNMNFLERCIILTSEDQLLALQRNLHLIFGNTCKALQSTNKVRQAHALETMSIFLKSIFRKKFSNFGVDVVTLLSGINVADELWPLMIMAIDDILKKGNSEMRAGAINLLEIIISANENINQNTLLEYVMIVDLFEGIMRVVVDPSSPFSLSISALYALSLLANYKKYEAMNIYMKRIAELNDQKILTQIANVLTQAVIQSNNQYLQGASVSSAGFFSSLTGYLGMGMGGSTVPLPTATKYPTASFLLILYEITHLNPYFSELLFTPTYNTNTEISTTISTEINPTQQQQQPPQQQTSEIPKLISPLFSLFTHIFSNAKDIHSPPLSHPQIYPKISLLILTCLVENQSILPHLHDITYAIPLKITPKSSTPEDQTPKGKATVTVQKSSVLSSLILDLVSLFIKNSVKDKKPPLEYFDKAIGIVHHLICFQKRVGLRLPYNWKELWHVLFLALKFINTNNTPPGSIYPIPDVLVLTHHTITVFNLFITFGDTFLPAPSDYDDLYYDLMRHATLLESIYVMLEKSVSSFNSSFTNFNLNIPPPLIIQGLGNIRTIIAHFSGKLEVWSLANLEVSLTPDQVLKVIRNNYDTLKLKLQDNLEYIDPYVENPNEVSFFRLVIRSLLVDQRATITVSQITIQITPPSSPSSSSSNTNRTINNNNINNNNNNNNSNSNNNTTTAPTISPRP